MIGISRNGITIGAVRYPDRKKQCLVIRKGNQDHIIGHFINDYAVDAFSKALDELLERSNNNDR